MPLISHCMVADVRVAVPWFCSTTSTGIGPLDGRCYSYYLVNTCIYSTWIIFLSAMSGVASLFVPSISSTTIDNGVATLFKSV